MIAGEASATQRVEIRANPTEARVLRLVAQINQCTLTEALRIVIEAARGTMLVDQASDSTRRRVGDLEVDARRRVARRAGRELHLTGRESALLHAFVRHAGEVLSREELLNEVWGVSGTRRTNVVDVFVGYLRRKLEAEGEPRLLHTVHGVGWVLRP